MIRDKYHIADKNKDKILIDSQTKKVGQPADFLQDKESKSIVNNDPCIKQILASILSDGKV